MHCLKVAILTSAMLNIWNALATPEEQQAVRVQDMHSEGNKKSNFSAVICSSPLNPV